MTISTLTKTLLNAVSTTVNFMQKEGDFAGMITIGGKEGKLEIKSSNNEQTVVYKNISFVSSDITEDSFKHFSINGKKLYTALKSAKTEEVHIELNQDSVIVQSARSKVKIETLAKTQEIHIAEGENTFDIISQISHIEKVLHSVDINNPKYEFNGLLMQIKDGILNIVSTDTKRLSVVCSNTSSEDLEIILPKKSAETIIKLFKDSEVSARIDHDTLVMSTEHLTYSTRLTAGKFPEWQRIVPKTSSKKIQIESLFLESLVKEASLFDDEIIINMKDNKIKVSDLGGNTKVEDDFELNDEILIAIKAHAILDFIKSADENSIEINYNDSNMPFVLIANDSHKEIVMPIVLQENEIEEIKNAA